MSEFDLLNVPLKVVLLTADEDIKEGRRVQLTKEGLVHHNWFFRLCFGILLEPAVKGEKVRVLTFAKEE